jgi:nicotinate-nucleotide pyrophosphorylase
MSAKTLSTNGIAEYSRLLAKENTRLIKEAGKHMGVDTVDAMLTMFLMYYVESLVSDTLQLEGPEPETNAEKEVIYSKLQRRYKIMKMSIQSGVADAFKTAVSKITKKQVDYYCTVDMVPEPQNKLPC